MNINGNSSGRQPIRSQPVIRTNNFGALFTDLINIIDKYQDSMKYPHCNMKTGNVLFYYKKRFACFE